MEFIKLNKRKRESMELRKSDFEEKEVSLIVTRDKVWQKQVVMFKEWSIDKKKESVLDLHEQDLPIKWIIK